MSLLAISRVDVADYVETLVTVYTVLIFMRIIASYFQRIPYNRFLDAFLTFLHDVTEPFLGLFRRASSRRSSWVPQLSTSPRSSRS